MIWREEKEKDSEHIKFLIQLVNDSGAKCFWVGPPDLKPKTQDQLRRVQEVHLQQQRDIKGNECSLIESWSFTNYPEGKGDGIHYDQVPFIGKDLARKWAKNVFSLIHFQ